MRRRWFHGLVVNPACSPSLLTVDPKLLRGEVEYDLGCVLWTRLDEMPTDSDIVRQFDTAVAAAGIARDRARDWVICGRWTTGYGALAMG